MVTYPECRFPQSLPHSKYLFRLHSWYYSLCCCFLKPWSKYCKQATSALKALSASTSAVHWITSSQTITNIELGGLEHAGEVSCWTTHCSNSGRTWTCIHSTESHKHIYQDSPYFGPLLKAPQSILWHSLKAPPPIIVALQGAAVLSLKATTIQHHHTYLHSRAGWIASYFLLTWPTVRSLCNQWLSSDCVCCSLIAKQFS